MTKTKKEVIAKLQDMLDECMSSFNQEGSLVITDIDGLDDPEYRTGNIKFDWCECEGEPYFVGY